jgi:hypothetical protein
MKRSGFLAIGLVVLAAVALWGQNDVANPQLGTWKMNVAKSKFSSGTGFKSATSKIEAVDSGVRHTLDTLYADGTSRHYEYITSYDGVDRPVNGPSPYGNTTALTRIDTRTVRTVYKENGKITVIQISAVSKDGRTRTVTTTGTNPKGQTVHNVAIYDRQ